MIETIGVTYSCRECRTVDRKVAVTKRRKDEDVVHWVQLTVVSHIAVDHRRRSPRCNATTMENIKIPVVEGDQLGGSR